MWEFEKLYDELHSAGYYIGFLYDVDGVKDAIKVAVFIEKKLDKRMF